MRWRSAHVYFGPECLAEFMALQVCSPVFKCRYAEQGTTVMMEVKAQHERL